MKGKAEWDWRSEFKVNFQCGSRDFEAAFITMEFNFDAYLATGWVGMPWHSITISDLTQKFVI